MARVGMRHLVFAPIATETPGSAITYGTGVVMGRVVRGTVNWSRNDNPLYGDDVVAENDNGVTGYTLDVETTELIEGTAAIVLGYTATGTDDPEYDITDASAPYGGCGYIQVLIRRGVQTFKAVWYHKVQFGVDTEETQTKEQQVTWGTPALNGQGFGVFNDASGKAKFRKEKVFTTEAAAVSYLNGLANIPTA